MDDAFWVSKIKRGETRYFENIYEQHKGKLYSLCYRFTRNSSDAEEQLQEIFMKLISKIDKFQGKSSFGTWLYRLAVNHLINYTKGDKHREDVALEEVKEEGATRGDPDLSMALRKAVQQLPEGFRKVFVLHDQEGLRHEEIAAILGCSPATSRSQLCRARLALRERLQPMLSRERTT